MNIKCRNVNNNSKINSEHFILISLWQEITPQNCRRLSNPRIAYHCIWQVWFFRFFNAVLIFFLNNKTWPGTRLILFHRVNDAFSDLNMSYSFLFFARHIFASMCIHIYFIYMFLNTDKLWMQNFEYNA